MQEPADSKDASGSSDEEAQLAQAIARYDLFAGLSRDKIPVLATALSVKSFEDEEIVCQCPNASHDAFLVLEGKVAITQAFGDVQHALLRTYANRVYFLAPAHAYEEVATHLAQVLKRRGLGEEAMLLLLQEVIERLPILVAPVPPDVYNDLEQKPASGFQVETREIGRFSRSPFVSTALSGPKMRTSSGPEFRIGRQTELSCTWHQSPRPGANTGGTRAPLARRYVGLRVRPRLTAGLPSRMVAQEPSVTRPRTAAASPA